MGGRDIHLCCQSPYVEIMHIDYPRNAGDLDRQMGSRTHQKVTADQPAATRRSRRVNALETAVERQRVQLTIGSLGERG